MEVLIQSEVFTANKTSAAMHRSRHGLFNEQQGRCSPFLLYLTSVLELLGASAVQIDL